MIRIEDYRGLVSDEVLASIYQRARKLYGKRIVHVNSTYSGGGVATLLEVLVPLMNDVGLEADWRVMHGDPDFFTVTKSFHNALQGASFNLTEERKKLYLDVNKNFSRFTHFDQDCVIIHDPQPLPQILYYAKRQPWIWRCHIDLTEPHRELWDFVKALLLKYDQVIISSQLYQKKDLPVPQRIIAPAITPLSAKNRRMTEEEINTTLEKAKIKLDKPIFTQISRLDPWKDPEGVLDVFALVKKETDCRLVLCYNLAGDDPEGVEMYTKVFAKARAMFDEEDVVFAGGTNDLLVNALQRRAAVVVQKSIREGFCLAVTEAMWKGTPVVASNVGGIPLQIEDGVNGYLCEPKDTAAFAEKILRILKNPDKGNNMGEKARETVRQKFLVTRLLSDYLDLFNDMLLS